VLAPALNYGMTKWNIKNDKSEKNVPGYSLVILNLLSNRGIRTEKEIKSFFSSGYDDLPDPFLISDMEKAVTRILSAREKKEKVAIFGDYDADGVTATAVIFETLSQLGFEDVAYYIPDRQIEGYGMNEEAVKYLGGEGVSLIITVDCGITSFKEIERARGLGIDVIITDHHHVLDAVPEALAVINPNVSESGFEFKDLAGVGVAFKLAQALFQRMDPGKSDQLKWVLDLVAIGTIADCVTLLGENRILAKYGLIVLSKTRRVGLQEMFKVGRIDISENNPPDAHKVAFQISPRINAAGRMDHASVSYKLIIEKNRAIARNMALEVESKNQERQKVTAEIVREVEAIATNSFRNKKLIFAESPHWQVGILGLVAGKIADEFKKPTIILQRQENEFVGSLRSIPEVDIMKILEKCSDLILRFGGHAQAAGVTVDKINIEKLYERMSELVEKELDGKEVCPTVDIDMEIRSVELDWELMNEIKKMEPFGMGNPEPVFLMKDVEVVEAKVCGNGSKHWKLSLRNGSSPKIFDSIGFSMGEKFPDIKKGDKLDIVFNLQEDSWNGNKKLQLRLIDLKKND